MRDRQTRLVRAIEKHLAGLDCALVPHPTGDAYCIVGRRDRKVILDHVDLEAFAKANGIKVGS